VFLVLRKEFLMGSKNISVSVCMFLIFLMSFGFIAFVSAFIDGGDIVAVWLFNEGSGEVAHDSSGNGNDAEFQGAPEWVDGKIDKALWFNGSTDYVAAPDSESLDINGDQLTIVAWVNGEGWPAANHVVRKVADSGTGAIYILRVDPNTARIFLNTEGADESMNGSTVLPLNEWIHLAMVYDGAEARIYVNGELDGSKPQSGDVTQSDNELRIGRGEPAGYFQGTIDEVALFSSALEEADIREIMDFGLDQIVLPVEPLKKIPLTWAEVKVSFLK
jgi:arabinan endo-1,5-alpha-L-arabinosidase